MAAASPPPGATTLLPICCACRRPLQGDLVASRCNHAFHRECMKAGPPRCPKCHSANWAVSSFDLFGLNFTEATGQSSSDVTVLAAVQEQLLQDRARQEEATQPDEEDDDVEIISPGPQRCTAAKPAANEEERGLATLVVERTRAQTLRKKCEDERAKLDALGAYHARQESKLKEAKASAKQVDDELSSMTEQKNKNKRVQEALLEEVQQTRLRDTPLEYWEMLDSDSAGANTYLIRSASFMPDEARFCADINRLVNHHRKINSKCQRDCNAVAKSLSASRRQLVEVEEGIEAHKRKLRRLDSNISSQQIISSDSLTSQSPNSGKTASRAQRSRAPLHELQTHQQ